MISNERQLASDYAKAMEWEAAQDRAIKERADKFGLAWIRGAFDERVARDQTLASVLSEMLVDVPDSEFRDVLEVVKQAAHMGNALAGQVIERLAYRHAVQQVERWGF